MIADYGYGYVTTSGTAASEVALASATHHGDTQQVHNHFFPSKEDQSYYNGSMHSYSYYSNGKVMKSSQPLTWL